MDGVSVYLYGSSARGDALPTSDTDILVACDNPIEFKQEKIDLSDLLDSQIDCEDVSVYSIRRLAEMYESGHLYAWHLYLESKFLKGDKDRLKMLGKPNAYTSYANDVEPLLDILKSIPKNIVSGENLIYEAGLAYVCVRNIAMSSSYFSKEGLCFSAYSPFYYSPHFPLSKCCYEKIRQARLSGTRGSEAPQLDLQALKSWADLMIDWAEKEINQVYRGGHETKIYG